MVPEARVVWEVPPPNGGLEGSMFRVVVVFSQPSSLSVACFLSDFITSLEPVQAFCASSGDFERRLFRCKGLIRVP